MGTPVRRGETSKSPVASPHGVSQACLSGVKDEFETEEDDSGIMKGSVCMAVYIARKKHMSWFHDP